MASFSIISDSACDLSSEQQKRFGLDGWIASNVIFPDGHLEKVDSDWNNITPEEYYGSMVDKKLLYKSATPGPEQIKEVFRTELEKGNDILCIVLSSGMSAIYNYSCVVAREMEKEYPDRIIRVIDSKRYSTAIAMACIYANELRQQGKDVREAAELTEAYLERIHQSGWMDDLFYLARAGRLSKGTAFMGTMIGVKPIADFNQKTGMFQVIGKARGVSRAFRAVVDYIRATIEQPEQQILFVSHSLRKELAERLAGMIRDELHPKELIIGSVGQSCGANIGPGLVAAFYYGKPLSDQLKEETAILQNILK